MGVAAHSLYCPPSTLQPSAPCLHQDILQPKAISLPSMTSFGGGSSSCACFQPGTPIQRRLPTASAPFHLCATHRERGQFVLACPPSAASFKQVFIVYCPLGLWLRPSAAESRGARGRPWGQLRETRHAMGLGCQRVNPFCRSKSQSACPPDRPSIQPFRRRVGFSLPRDPGLLRMPPRRRPAHARQSMKPHSGRERSGACRKDRRPIRLITRGKGGMKPCFRDR